MLIDEIRGICQNSSTKYLPIEEALTSPPKTFIAGSIFLFAIFTALIKGTLREILVIKILQGVFWS